MVFITILIIIVLIIVLVNQSSENKKLLEENRRLKEKLNKINGSVEETPKEKVIQEIPIQEQKVDKQIVDNKQQEVAQNTEKEVVQAPKKEEIVNKQKKVRNEKEQRNIAILVTGAICIVLSAIVFLVSTWNSIPDVLKTIVLALLTLVFFGGSYIAKDKFKLEKASQTFFYIAMAYIPICMISISFFGLFGEYLSIYGEGKYIYLMVVSIFISLIYYATYKNKNNKYMLGGSILSQLFSVISFSLILSNEILVIGINLLLYNIALMMLTKKDIFKKIYNIIPPAITILAVVMLGEQDVLMTCMLVLLSINYLILELNNSKKFYSYMFNITLTVSGIYTVTILKDIVSIDLSHLLSLGFVILVYTFEKLLLQGSEKKNPLNSITVITILTIGILHIESFINPNAITPYMISIVQIIILSITYIRYKSKGGQFIATLIPLYFIITGIDVIAKLNGSYHLYVLFAIVTFLIGELFRNKDKLIHINAFIISHIFISLTYIIVLTIKFNEFSNDILYSLILIGIHIYSYLINKNEFFKYLSYITSNFVLFTLFSLISNESSLLYFVPMISTIGIMGIELTKKKSQNDGATIYVTISQAISFIFMYFSMISIDKTISTVMEIFFALLIIAYNNILNKKEFNILPLICVMPAIFLNDFSTGLKTGIMILTIIITTINSLKEKKISMYTIFSGIYLFFTTISIEKSVYLKEILFICWAGIHLLYLKEKGKNLFKFLFYISILFLYNSIISDLQVDQYTAFSMLGYIIVAILTIRTILIKKIDSIDILEYIVFGLIYISALSQYTDVFDGILFGVLLVFVVIASYINKYGALFITTIIALIVNIFVLTREFWFSVPWWAYLLTIGTGLIAFAIKNEVSEKKMEINAIVLLKNIKDKVEK